MAINFPGSKFLIVCQQILLFWQQNIFLSAKNCFVSKIYILAAEYIMWHQKI